MQDKSTNLQKYFISCNIKKVYKWEKILSGLHSQSTHFFFSRWQWSSYEYMCLPTSQNTRISATRAAILGVMGSWGD